MCAREELGRREKGEVALSVCLPLPLPGQLEVPPERREPTGRVRGAGGGTLGRPGARVPAARCKRGPQPRLGWRHDSSAPAAPRPPSAPTYPRHPENSVRRRREGRKPQINSGGSSASSGGAGSAGRVRRLVLSARPPDFAMGWGPQRLRASGPGQRRRRPLRG